MLAPDAFSGSARPFPHLSGLIPGSGDLAGQYVRLQLEGVAGRADGHAAPTPPHAARTLLHHVG
jgi:hypothetical protein